MARPADDIIALVRDLLFISRITAAAGAAGTTVHILRDPAQLAAAASPSRRLLVDLNLPGAIEAATLWKQSTCGHVTGFVSHVDAESIARARAAGIDPVLSRSRFVELLPKLLSPAPRARIE
jgi:hypothetical protein